MSGETIFPRARYRRWPIVALVAILAVLLGWFAISPKEVRPLNQPVLRVGSQRGGTKSLMIAAGVLQDLPYRVEWSEFPAAQHLLEALGADAIDLGAAGDAPFLFSYASGSPIKAVAVAKDSSAGRAVAIVVPAASPIRTLADLRGKSIATGRVSAGHYLVLSALEKGGLKPTDVRLVYLAPADAKAAFASGSVDAWATWSPFLSAALLHDKVRVIVDGRGLVAGEGYQIASDKAIAAKHAQIADFLSRLARAYRWAQTHQSDYTRALQRETGLPADVAAHFTASFRPLAEPISRATIGNARHVLDEFAAAGAVRSKRPVAAAFDSSFNTGARSDAGLQR